MGRKGPTRGTSLVYESVISWVRVEICSSVSSARSGGRSAREGVCIAVAASEGTGDVVGDVLASGASGCAIVGVENLG